jgi:hypothetical protein
MDADLERQLVNLLAERDIYDVLVRYCRAVDRCDQELLSTCFHPDAVDDHGSWVCTGRDSPEHIVSRLGADSASAMHFLGNVRIEMATDDRAYVESYLLAFRAFSREERPHTRTRALRFVDRFERRDGQWRVSERVVVDDWSRIDAVVEEMAEAHQFRHGSKDRSDPVYGIQRGRIAREPD